MRAVNLLPSERKTEAGGPAGSGAKPGWWSARVAPVSLNRRPMRADRKPLSFGGRR